MFLPDDDSASLGFIKIEATYDGEVIQKLCWRGSHIKFQLRKWVFMCSDEAAFRDLAALSGL
jgi:uncharacterized protein CbrC (UPF0167 family)